MPYGYYYGYPPGVPATGMPATGLPYPSQPVYPSSPYMAPPVFNGYPQQPPFAQGPQTANEPTPFFNLANPKFLKGAALGAAAAYLLTNENVQRAAIKTSVKTWMMLQGGLEEMKERFKDAEAEIVASESGE